MNSLYPIFVKVKQNTRKMRGEKMQRLIWLIQKPDVSDSKQYVNNKHVRDRLNIEPRNSMLSQFDNLKNVSTENKEELRELVNSYQNEFAKASVKTNKVSNIIIQIICGIPTTIVICFVFIISLISFISNSFYILLNFVPRSFEKNIILVILLYLLFYCLILFLFTYPI